ncbi:MAG: NAD+ synthase, partial [Alphaproteobacteria bacterium]|nr:NAD+ synthase [Alphaproteobacteria bacterium]
MRCDLALALAQINPVVGDVDGNAERILAARAACPDAHLLVFPELALVGYPPEDLVLKPALLTATRAALDRLAAATSDGGPALLVGTP